MALKVFDLVMETTTTTGTGTITLGGPVSGFRAFGASGLLADGDTTYYAIALGADFEVGLGTYTASGNTLARTTVIASSNAGGLVNFPTGTKTVRMTFPAALLAATLPNGTPKGVAVEIDDLPNFGVAGRGFTIETRHEVSFTYPVAVFQPTQANTRMVFDLMPKGAPTGVPGWIDVCSTDLKAFPSNPGVAARVTCRPDRVAFGSFSYNGAAVVPCTFEVNNIVRARLNEKGMLIGSTTLDATYQYHAVGTDSNGDLIDMCFFSSDVAGVGASGTLSNHDWRLFSNNATRWVLEKLGNFIPAVNKAYNIGSATRNLLNLFTAAVTFSSTAPSSSADTTGVANEVRVVGGFVYYKTASGWLRLQGATF